MTGPPPVADAFEFVGLVRRFGEVVALDDVSFRVAAGEMVGFVGPNGAGKTTAMRIALGLLQADAGAVRWRGREVDAETRRRFGYMPEERGLYPKMRVLDQLVYLARLHGLEPGDARSQAERMTEMLGVGRQQAERDPHRGRLAGTVRADEPDHFAGRDAERHVVERDDLAEVPHQPDELERVGDRRRFGHDDPTVRTALPRTRRSSSAVTAEAASVHGMTRSISTRRRPLATSPASSASSAVPSRPSSSSCVTR